MRFFALDVIVTSPEERKDDVSKRESREGREGRSLLTPCLADFSFVAVAAAAAHIKGPLPLLAKLLRRQKREG